METVKVHTYVGQDGILKLEVPISLSNTDLEVVVVMQPLPVPVKSREEWLAFIERTAGSLAHDPIERPPQGEYETRDPIE